MRIIISLLLVAFNALSLWGQNTFSKRFHFEFPAAVLTSIISTDSCYYVTGVIADSIPPYEAGNVFVKFSIQGEIGLLKTVRDTVKSYQTWLNNLKALPEGGFAAAGYTVDSLMRALLIVYDEDGDTVFTAQFPNPYYPDEGFIFTRDIEILENGYLLLNWIGSPEGINNDEIQILRLNKEGELLWEEEYGITSKDDTPHNIIATPSGYIIVSIRDNTNVARQNYEARNHIFKINEDGDVLWEYFSPTGELRGKEGRGIATTDGGLLVITGQGVEVYINPETGQMRWHNYVFKLDSSRQEEWSVLIRDSLPAIYPVNVFSSALELDNNEGYVVAGSLAEYHSERSWHVGVLAKIGPNGNLLWQRHYQHLTGAWFWNYINDLAQASDGGFIMVGEVRDTINAPRQQGWLLKVDEYGCLVPGCELANSAEETKTGGDAKVNLLLYPNPVGEQLQLYFSAEESAEYAFRILDAQGREWRRFETQLPEVTLMVDVGELPGGGYFLQCLKEGNVVQVERFVKQ
ncbi:MAG: T9SS type A sorting domain-containing protein [Lewinellaceae bacterium]|nr:T9SS type A sorting domain-containing protein [Lewinellaceae bacterium]